MKPTPKPSRKGWPLGKPRKPGVPLATTWIQLRVTKARKAAYERAALAKGLKLSPWALAKLDAPADAPELAERLRLLSAACKRLEDDGIDEPILNEIQYQRILADADLKRLKP